MKKYCIIFLLSIIISLTVFGGLRTGTQNRLSPNPPITQEYLRIHIRADSNASDAQAVKYHVRDKLVDYLTPLVAACPTKTAAIHGVESKLQALAQIATQTLLEQGFSYGATATLEQTSFPTRIYGEYTLPAGEYTALIVCLGRGEGDNWWCVVYPPLCFAATGNNVIYKSKIAEIIRNWKANQ
jgi:stage II sporulation protein R